MDTVLQWLPFVLTAESSIVDCSERRTAVLPRSIISKRSYNGIYVLTLQDASGEHATPMEQ